MFVIKHFQYWFQNTSSSESSGSDWECSGAKESSARKPQFSVTSCDTGLKLKIAAVPRKGTPKRNTKPTVKKKIDDIPLKITKTSKDKSTVKKKKSQLSDTTSSSESCKCTSDSSSDDDIPLKTVSKSLPSKCSPQKFTKGTKTSQKSESEDDARLSIVIDKVSKSNSKDRQSASRSKVVQKTKSEESNEGPVKRPGGRLRNKVSNRQFKNIIIDTW